MPVLPRSQVSLPDSNRASAGPIYEPGLFEGVAASFRTAEDEQDLLEQAPRNAEAYQDLLDSLAELGVDTSVKGPLYTNARTGGTPGMYSTRATRRVFDRGAILAEVSRQRAKNPKLFAGVAETQEEYDRAIANRFGARADDLRTASQAGLTANIVGGIGSAMTDPVNLALSTAGAGTTTLAKTVLFEAALGGISEAVLLPDAKRAFDRMGEDFTASDAARRVATGAVASGVLGGVAKIGFDNFAKIKSAPKAVQEAAWARVIPYLPEKHRPTMNWDVAEDFLPDIAEGLIGKENLSADQMAAVTVMRREADIKAGSPFVPNGAGVAAHEETFAESLQRVIDGAANRNIDTARPSLSRLRGSTAIGSRTVASGGGEILKQRIGHVESSGGANFANPNSSARGLYQFIDGTWLSYYKRRFGTGGLSDAAILAKRSDPSIQNVLMDDLIADNRRALANAGIAESAGNLYLAHFAGSKGAIRLHAADPSAPISSILGASAVKANPFMKGWTAKDAIDWAHRKMGQRTAEGGGLRVRDDVGEQPFRDALQAEIDRLENERLLLDEQLAEGDDISAVIRGSMDDEAVPISEIAADIGPMEPAADIPGSVSVEAQAILPRLREIVKDRSVSLNRGLDALADELGVTESDLRSALQALAFTGEIRQNKNGAFARLSSGTTGPDDMLTFVARNGGLTPSGIYDDIAAVNGSKGHDLGRILETMRRQKVRDPLTGLMTSKDIRIGNRLVPGVGAVLRDSGKSLDDMGELLFEAGYFPERPTESEVIEALSRSAGGERIFSDRDLGAVMEAQAAARDLDGEELDYWQTVAARDLGIELTEEDFLLARDLLLDLPETDFLELDDMIQLKVQMLVNRQFDDFLEEAWEAGKDEVYEQLDDNFARILESENSNGAGTGGGQDAVEGAPGQSNATGRQRTEDNRPDELTGPIDPDTYRQFDDPDGDGVKAVADSMEHDLRASIEGEREQADFAAPTAEQQRIALERQGEGRMQSDKAQKPAGSEGGLFDNNDMRDLAFRFDKDGDPLSVEQLFADLDAEQKMIDDIKGCL